MSKELLKAVRHENNHITHVRLAFISWFTLSFYWSFVSYEAPVLDVEPKPHSMENKESGVFH